MAVIFYLSGTGNSLYAARQIAGRLSGCHLEKISAYLASPYAVQDEIVGIICPVYCFALPPVVEAFLKKLRAAPVYTFGLVTMGGGAGNSLGQLRELLAARGIILNYAASLVMPDNYFSVPQQVRNKILARAEKRLPQLAEAIAKQRQDVSAVKNSFFWRSFGTALCWQYIRRWVKISALTVDNAKCVGCGVCRQICPMGNIALQNGRPVFGLECANCLGCLHWCPKSAISAGRLRVNAKTRYVNPKIKVADMEN